MNKPTEVTVTFTYEEFTEVVNLLQLVAVVGIKLYMQGMPQPDKEKLLAAFDKMARANMEQRTKS